MKRKVLAAVAQQKLMITSIQTKQLEGMNEQGHARAFWCTK